MLQAQISSRGSICQIKRPRLFQVKPATFEVETSPQLQTSAVPAAALVLIHRCLLHFGPEQK